MVIELADDLVTGVNGEDLATIELLLHSRRLGYHLLVGSDQVFNDLHELDLSPSGRAIVKRTQHRQVQKRGLREAVTFRVRVSSGRESCVIKTVGCTVINMRLADLRGFSSVAPTIVLGENVRDARLAEVMARVYALSHGMSQVKRCSSPLGGGGDTTGETFRGIRDETRLCICVVDSDRKDPLGGLGPTARKVVREVDHEKPWAYVIVTQCREAENQLSSKLVEIAVDDDVALSEMVPALENLDSNSPVAELRDYCDVRNGTLLEWVFSLPDGSTREFWMRRVGGCAILPLVKSGCVEGRRCCKLDACECWLVPGFGKGLLDRCLDAMDRMSTHKIAEGVCASTRRHWDYIGSAVFSWTCGAEKVVV